MTSRARRPTRPWRNLEQAFRLEPAQFQLANPLARAYERQQQPSDAYFVLRAYSHSQGHYEQATRELAPALLLEVLYAGGKGLRWASYELMRGWFAQGLAFERVGRPRRVKRR